MIFNHEFDGKIWDKVISETEKELILAALKLSSYNQCKAAKKLGINRNTLRKKIKEYEIVCGYYYKPIMSIRGQENVKV